MDLPLFGEERQKLRWVNYVVAAATAVIVLFTLVVSFVKGLQASYVHVFTGFVVVLSTIPSIILGRWYRNGELDPKFKYLIFYMCAMIVLFCIAANVYFFLGFQPTESDPQCPP